MIDDVLNLLDADDSRVENTLTVAGEAQSLTTMSVLMNDQQASMTESNINQIIDEEPKGTTLHPKQDSQDHTEEVKSEQTPEKLVDEEAEELKLIEQIHKDNTFDFDDPASNSAAQTLLKGQRFDSVVPY